MWRRQHQEGPIDDRWTRLRLDEDESTGELKIVESRKEWYLGSRTYHKTDIVFPEPLKDEELDFAYIPPVATSSASILAYLPALPSQSEGNDRSKSHSDYLNLSPNSQNSLITLHSYSVAPNPPFTPSREAIQTLYKSDSVHFFPSIPPSFLSIFQILKFLAHP